MRCPKLVTSSKVEANRRNAKHSSRPRTGRGKRSSRFNAVTLGLLAKHVVIPICDGFRPEKEFQTLLDGLHQDFQPVGGYEEWLVVKIAECMWRLRRATRCESGSVREAAIWADRSIRDGYRDDNQRILDLAMEIRILSEAEEQLQISGTLSQKIYEKVAPLIEKERDRAIQAERDDKRVETEFDREIFLTCITDRKESPMNSPTIPFQICSTMGETCLASTADKARLPLACRDPVSYENQHTPGHFSLGVRPAIPERK